MSKPASPNQLIEAALQHVTGGVTIGRGPGDAPSSSGLADGGQLVLGSGGNDVVDDRKGAERILLLAGDDQATIDDAGADTVIGGAGNDTVTVFWLESQGGMHVDGGPGRDVIRLEFAKLVLTSEAPVIESETPFTIVNGNLVFEGPASGTVTWDGRTMTFSGIEAIEGGVFRAVASGDGDFIRG
jgi:Ca2+-binding RTX toxin-like protein